MENMNITITKETRSALYVKANKENREVKAVIQHILSCVTNTNAMFIPLPPNKIDYQILSKVSKFCKIATEEEKQELYNHLIKLSK